MNNLLESDIFTKVISDTSPPRTLVKRPVTIFELDIVLFLNIKFSPYKLSNGASLIATIFSNTLPVIST